MLVVVAITDESKNIVQGTERGSHEEGRGRVSFATPMRRNIEHVCLKAGAMRWYSWSLVQGVRANKQGLHREDERCSWVDRPQQSQRGISPHPFPLLREILPIVSTSCLVLAIIKVHASKC